MGLGVWTTVEGVVYPSSGRYGGGFQWMVVDEDRITTNTSKLRLRPYVEKKKNSNSDTYNLAYQTSYFEVGGSKKTIRTAFDFRKASVGTLYPVSSDYPLKTDAGNKYVEYEIPHNDNGSATVSIVGLIKGEASSSHFQKVTTTAAITLPPIYRVATVAAQDTPIGGMMKIYLGNTNPELKYTVFAALSSGVIRLIANEEQGNYFEWYVPPDSIYPLIPSDTYSICDIYCETYTASGEKIGTEFIPIRLYVDEVPDFNVTATTDSTDGTLLINGISTVTINVTDLKATTGASAGFTFNISDGERSRSTNPVYFEKAKKDTYSVTVTDGRGISTTKQISITNVSPYVPPSIGSVDIQRDIETGEISVDVKGLWTSGLIDIYMNTQMVIHVKVPKTDPVISKMLFIDSSSGESITISDFSTSFTIEGLAIDGTYTLELYPTDIFYGVDDPTFPSPVFKAPIRRAVPAYQWKEGTFRVNGNLEVTGTYPGVSGGGGTDLSGYVTDDELTQALNKKLSTSGGTMTGALNVNGLASMDTNGYVTGTWLRMTADTLLGSTPTEGICVKQNGWIYTRTLSQMRSDIGAVSSSEMKTYVNEICGDIESLLASI